MVLIPFVYTYMNETVYGTGTVYDDVYCSYVYERKPYTDRIRSVYRSYVYGAKYGNHIQGVPVLVCKTKLGDRDHRSKKILSKDPCPEMNRLASRRM